MTAVLTSHALLIRGQTRQFMCRYLIHTHHKHLFLTLKTIVQKQSVFVIFIICPLWRPRGISQLVSGPYYVTRDTGSNIHIGAKLSSLGRAKVFSSVATNFRLNTIVSISEISSLYLASVAAQAGLSLTWSETPKTGFLVAWLICNCPWTDSVKTKTIAFRGSPFQNLTHICLMDPSILINWTSPFPILGVSGVFFIFILFRIEYFC